MEKYIGITIGPIYDTISLTSKPAGMWAASYLFSYISRKICEGLIYKMGIEYKQFISPYFELDEKEKQVKRPILGVGVFPDRIIFRSAIPVSKYKNFFESIKKELEKKIEGCDINKRNSCEYVKNYIQIYAVEKEIEEGKNPILELSPYLDNYELQRCFVQNEDQNPIITFFNHDKEEESASKNIKESFLVRDCTDKNGNVNWDLLDRSNKIKNLEDIANNDLVEIETRKKLKRNKYYAIVQSDGDRMGNLLGSLKSIEQIQSFSKCMYKYAVLATEKIRKYGGIPIYIGGDDVLFIAPLIGKTEKKVSGQISILTLVEDISKSFEEVFQKFMKENLKEKEISNLKDYPTLSWGLEINYYKFPLYEAFDRVGELLFGIAKKTRNTIVIECVKHSGQNCIIEIQKQYDISNNLIYDRIKDLLELSVKISNYTDKTSQPEIEFLQSVPQKIERFYSTFKVAKTEEDIIHIWNNIFDSDIHKEKLINNYLEKIRKLYIVIWDNCSENKIERTNQMLCNIIRMLRLYIETRED